MIGLYNSVKDTIKQRISSPFLGTFIFIFIIYNWELFYTLFNFDNGVTLDYKIEKLKGFEIKGKFWWAILYTLVVLLLSYTLSSIGIYISGIGMFFKRLYYNRITPLIEKITKGKYVTINEYDDLLKLYNNSQNLVQELRTTNNNLLNLEKKKKEEDITNDVDKIIEKLKKDNHLADTFKTICKDIKSSVKGSISLYSANIMSFSEDIKEILSLELLKYEEIRVDEESLALTELGDKVWDELKFE